MLLKRYDYLILAIDEKIQKLNKKLNKTIEEKKRIYLGIEITKYKQIKQNCIDERLELAWPIGATIIHNNKKFTVNMAQGTVINGLNCYTDFYMKADDGEFLELPSSKFHAIYQKQIDDQTY
jgi:hypothetical protein